MGFQSAISGLNSASKNLDVIGNNIANSSVVGFKTSRSEFADVYASSLSSGGAQVGLGSQLAAVSQQFSQGNFSVTNNPLDLAINGQGFLRLSQNGAISYSRNGQLHLDKDGYLVNNATKRVTGYGTDASGTVQATSPVELQISKADLLPVATQNVDAGLNLNASSAVIAAAFDATDSTTYNNSTSLTVYDSLGGSHTASVYFQKSAANAWDVFLSLDGAAPTALTPAAVSFNTDGTLALPADGKLVSAAITVTGAANLTLTFDLSEATQFGSAFGVTKLSQDGYASGRLNGFNIGTDGTILGSYTNGQSRALGQLILANFANPQGLQPNGNNEWLESSTSGAPLVGAPNTGALGVIQSGTVEDSNVDLTAELVNMITAQRIYQANAQSIKTEDQIMQTLVNLR